MKVLHIVATPRGAGSNTLKVSEAFLTSLGEHHDIDVDVIDLFTQDLPAVAGDNIESKYNVMTGAPIDPAHAESWAQVERIIEHFKSADLYLISSPMWNLSIPYALKYYIDCLVQPGYAFRYNETGQPVGMILDKKMVCVTSRGGDYSPSSAAHSFDFQEPYLRAIFGFIGISDVQFINAEPMDITADLHDASMTTAMTAARDMGALAGWS